MMNFLNIVKFILNYSDKFYINGLEYSNYNFNQKSQLYTKLLKIKLINGTTITNFQSK